MQTLTQPCTQILHWVEIQQFASYSSMKLGSIQKRFKNIQSTSCQFLIRHSQYLQNTEDEYDHDCYIISKEQGHLSIKIKFISKFPVFYCRRGHELVYNTSKKEMFGRVTTRQFNFPTNLLYLPGLTKGSPSSFISCTLGTIFKDQLPNFHCLQKDPEYTFSKTK